jgi:hypothetical protein
VMLPMPSFENSFLATLINNSLVSIVDIYDDKMIILCKITQMCSFVQKKRCGFYSKKQDFVLF